MTLLGLLRARPPPGARRAPRGAALAPTGFSTLRRQRNEATNVLICRAARRARARGAK